MLLSFTCLTGDLKIGFSGALTPAWKFLPCN
jgi:hypothetical protein